MNNYKLPCFYHPTTVTILDDDQIFLENITANLNNKILYQKFDSPQKALTTLLSQQENSPTPQDFLQFSPNVSDEFSEHGKHPINLDLSGIYKKIFNPDRFNIPSVVIVDHDMPGMNGVTFCEKLNDTSIRKIMLTGVADHKIAINAFNKKIIHKFIMKDEPNIFKLIDEAVSEMQLDYFINLSKIIIQNITASTFSYLEDKYFINFVLEYIKNNSIKEFYLIDPIGSFLFVNSEGKLIWFIVKSDQEISNDYQIAIDQNAPDDIIHMLADRKKLLFLFSEDDYKQHVNQWYSHLHPTQKIANIDGCFYSLIPDENVNKISRAKSLSYTMTE